jgi:hypothetical protein
MKSMKKREAVNESGDLPSRKRYGKARESGLRVEKSLNRSPISSPLSSAVDVGCKL